MFIFLPQTHHLDGLLYIFFTNPLAFDSWDRMNELKILREKSEVLVGRVETILILQVFGEYQAQNNPRTENFQPLQL
jgi:hypothetical protein